MTPFKRARRGEWAYVCWRDVHVPSRTHTHHTRVEMHLVACVWEYGVLFFGQVGAWTTTLLKHLSTCQTWRVGVCMLAICAHVKSHAFSPHTSREVCVWEHGVLFFGQVGTWSTTLP